MFLSCLEIMLLVWCCSLLFPPVLLFMFPLVYVLSRHDEQATRVLKLENQFVMSTSDSAKILSGPFSHYNFTLHISFWLLWMLFLLSHVAQIEKHAFWLWLFLLLHCSCFMMLAYINTDQTNTGINGLYQHIMQDVLWTWSLSYFPMLHKVRTAQRLTHSHHTHTHTLLYSSLSVFVIPCFIVAANLFIKTIERFYALPWCCVV